MNETNGHWITLHGGDGEGTHVFIGGDGTIQKGPAALAGKKIHDLKAAGHHTSETHHGELTSVTHPPTPAEIEPVHYTTPGGSAIKIAHDGKRFSVEVNGKSIEGNTALYAGSALRQASPAAAAQYDKAMIVSKDGKKTVIGIPSAHGEAVLGMLDQAEKNRSKSSSEKENDARAEYEAAKHAADKAREGAYRNDTGAGFDNVRRLDELAEKARQKYIGLSLSSAGLWLGPAAGAQTEATADGLTYWKDILVTGSYTDPKDGGTFEITPKLYDDIEASYAAMQAIGDEPPLLFDHHDGPREVAKNTAGYIKGLRRQGNTLQAKVRFADAESRTIGLRNKVSVRVLPDVQTSKGDRLKLALTHVALTPRPVLTHGMNDWNLALSRDGEGAVPETYFAAPIPTKESNMTPDQLAKVKDLVPTATDETAVDLLLAYAAQEAKNTETTALELSQVKAERDDLLKIKPLELSNSDLLYGKRAITGDLADVTKHWPQVAKDAATKYVTEKTRLGLMLSRVGDDRMAFDDFADFCRSIPLKGLQASGEEKTGIQTLELSRTVPDGKPAEGPVSDDRFKELMTASGMTV